MRTRPSAASPKLTCPTGQLLACYKSAAVPIFWRPKPCDVGQGWEKTEQGVLEPVWTCGPILPPSLIDLLDTGDSESDQNDDEEAEDDVEIDYDDVMDDDD